MARNQSRLFRAIVIAGAALPVAAVTVPVTLAVSACDDDDDTVKPDTGFGYIWDGSFPADAQPDASTDAGPGNDAAPKTSTRGS